MLRHALFLVFLCAIESCRGSASTSGVQQQTADSKDVYQNGIKKNEVGANGLESNWANVVRNFANPVLEHLLHSTPDRTNAEKARKGLVREIRHSQTLLMPSPMRSPWPALLLDQLPQIESLKKAAAEGSSNPESSPVDSFWNFLKNKTHTGDKTLESVVTSPVLHLNKDADETKETTTVQTYPALAVVINTFDKDGSLKKSVTHFQPDFHSLRPDANARAGYAIQGSKPNKVQNALVNFESGLPGKSSPPAVPWPVASYFPIVVHDPFLAVYSALSTSMYNAVSSVVEYGPDAEVCVKEQLEPKQTRPGVEEVAVGADNLERGNGKDRKRRDATSILVRAREGGTVGITLQEPTDVNDVLDERARSFGPTLVNTPLLSTILRPPQSGYADKRKKTKPSKPTKEEGNSEEVGEEHEEESTSQSQESVNEAVAISPPPEGASVAEAKPIGLAIAGPGGVAASKPQGTAVAGPGGLAIARPVGTAIAGVEVEGSVPIGGQQKNKKKPKQEGEQTEGELHYVGGLTGPIGNPQPKEFADSLQYKSGEGSNVQDKSFFGGVPNGNGLQLRLGQQNGNSAQGYDHFPKYETQF